MEQTLERSKLALILELLEEEARTKEGRAYRALRNGLTLRIEPADLGGYQLAIARKAPSMPSETEESVVLRDLAPLFAGAWHRFTNRRAADGAFYNGSVVDYHR